MRRLAVPLDELAEAMDEGGDSLTRAYFDRETGAIEYVPFELVDPTLFADVLGAPARWLRIPTLGAWQRQRLRMRFADDISDVHLRPRLLAALDERRPCSAFAQVLRQAPSVGDGWTQFRTQHLTTDVHAWLATLDIEPALALRS